MAALEQTPTVTSTYCGASGKSSLYEIFNFVQSSFPETCVLTLEGGDCKKPPKIPHFPDGPNCPELSLPMLSSIRILVLKSAWNIMRTEQDFNNLKAALPNIQEFHIQYSKAKSKSYLSTTSLPYVLQLLMQHQTFPE